MIASTKTGYFYLFYFLLSAFIYCAAAVNLAAETGEKAASATEERPKTPDQATSPNLKSPSEPSTPKAVLGIQIKFWTGIESDFYQTDLEQRFFLDDIIQGQNDTVIPGRIDLPFMNSDQFALPVQLQFTPASLPQIRLEGTYYGVEAGLFQHAFSDLPAPTRVHLIELSNYHRNSYSGGIAYAFTGFYQDNPISSLLIRVGYTRESQYFNYKPIVFSATGISVSPLENFWDAAARGYYVGGEFTFPLGDKWSVSARYDRSDSITGDMDHERLEISPDPAGYLFNMEKVTANYKIKRELRLLGFNYHITPDFKFSIGYQLVTNNVSYPDYFSYSISTVTAGIQFSPVGEMLSDRIIYGTVMQEKIGNGYFAFEKVFLF